MVRGAGATKVGVVGMKHAIVTVMRKMNRRHTKKGMAGMKKQSEFDKWFENLMGKRIHNQVYGSNRTTDRTLFNVEKKGVKAGLELRARKQWDNLKATTLQAWTAAQSKNADQERTK